MLGWALPGIPAFVSKKCNLKSLNFSLSNANQSCQLIIVGTEKAKIEFIFCNKHGGGQRLFEQCKKKLHFSLILASLILESEFSNVSLYNLPGQLQSHSSWIWMNFLQG